MKTTLIDIKKRQELTKIALSFLFCLLILGLRIKFTHSIRFLFMAWNLFLAVIPYGLVYVLRSNKIHLKYIPRSTRWICIAGILTLWLLFLPNAPYMLTDFIHFNTDSAIWWYDFILLSSFAAAGMYYCYLSLSHVEDFLRGLRLSRSIKAPWLSYVLLFQCALGVYLGRILRYNSWDLITAPAGLFHDLTQLLFNPMMYQIIWLQISGFSLVLMLGYYIFQRIKMVHV